MIKRILLGLALVALGAGASAAIEAELQHVAEIQETIIARCPNYHAIVTVRRGRRIERPVECAP